MPPDKYRYDAFIARSPSDDAWAAVVKTWLEDRGLSVQSGWRAGELDEIGLDLGFEHARHVVLVVSDEAIRSQWIFNAYRHLVTAARKRSRALQLIPAILGKAEVPGFLANRNWIEFLDDTTFAKNFERLVDGITGKKQPPIGPDESTTQVPWSMPLSNPYVFERPAIGEHFFGRGLEVRRLANALREGRSVAIYGLQRVGKTSLVKAALDHEKATSPIPMRDIRIDLYESADSLTGYVDFFETCLDRLCDDLPPADYKKVRGDAKSILRSGHDPNAIRTLIKAFFRRFAATYGRPILFIDEFQDIARSFKKAEEFKTIQHPIDSGFIRYLGSLIKDGYLQLVCCGRYHVLSLERDLKWELLKLTITIELGVLDDDSAKRLIREPVAGRFEFDEQAVQKLLALSGGYPYLIQYLCYEALERAMAADRTRITRNDIEELAAKVQEPQVGLLYNDFKELELGVPWRLLLCVCHLAQAEGAAVPTPEILTLYTKTFGALTQPTIINNSFTLLVNSQVLEQSPSDKVLSYHVRPDIVRIWLRQKKEFDRERIVAPQR